MVTFKYGESKRERTVPVPLENMPNVRPCGVYPVQPLFMKANRDLKSLVPEKQKSQNPEDVGHLRYNDISDQIPSSSLLLSFVAQRSSRGSLSNAVRSRLTIRVMLVLHYLSVFLVCVIRIPMPPSN